MSKKQKRPGTAEIVCALIELEIIRSLYQSLLKHWQNLSVIYSQYNAEAAEACEETIAFYKTALAEANDAISDLHNYVVGKKADTRKDEQSCH